ncbi:beta-ketoacyl-[acyl-carrier-protein] synthase family protein [Saccharothrix sp. BKS2]|uniref:beta-ketoacyl-[acyl-carrier-protein] synthase family protein n=1 Tax=Saccharothrix sp. BKS2 TaxID=3064400 RepID=UPI0039EC0D2F
MTDDDTRVVITGIGAVSCLGTGADALWKGLLAGGGEPVPVPEPHLNMGATKMYLVPEADLPAEPTAFAHVRLGDGPRFGVAAARQAIADAGLSADAVRDLPVVMGVEMGNASRQEQERAAHGRIGRWTPLTVTSAVVGAAIGSRAGNVSVGNACSAGGYALTIALDMIRGGEAEAVLVGGAEAFTRVGMGGFDRLGAADPLRCRPFDRGRRGTMFGDGAAMVVLESAAHAARRGARTYAELAGGAWSCDAHHPTAPDPSGAQITRCMGEALAESGLRPEDVGCILPHGTGTPLNDVVESGALRAVFGDACDRLPLLSLKAMIGHTAGAAAVFACVAGVLSLQHGQVPGNPPIDQDPECAVWVPQGEPVPLERPAVLVNAYAFGGNNASFVLTRGGNDR